MAIRNFAKWALAALAAVACTVKEPVEPQAPSSAEPAVSSAFIPGQATICFTREMAERIEAGLQTKGAVTQVADVNAMMREIGAVSLQRVFPDAGEFEERTRREGLHRYYKVVFSDATPVSKAVVRLGDLPGVESVTPSHRIEKRAVFNDPKLSQQWHYIGSNSINVSDVWTNYTVGGSKVIVNVVDEPVDASHPDLQGNLWKDEEGHHGYNFARDTWDMSIRPEGGYWADYKMNNYGDIGHGTHVAGTIAAVNNNGVGLCGIAGGDYAKGIPGVRILSSAIFSGFDAYADDAQSAAAIKWGADHGAVISQNSWGYPYDEENYTLSQWKKLNIANFAPDIKEAVDYFIKYAGCDNQGNQLPDSPMKGGLVIFAAGNDGVAWDIISTYEPIIAVGAYRPGLTRAYYSNYGSWVDIAAPGGEAGSSSTCIWSTLPEKVNDGYTDHNSGKGYVISTDYYGGEDWQGTSMACPHVSGVAALIISYFGGPGFTADDAKAILYGGLGSTIGGSKPIGKRLDATASFQYGIEHYTEADPQPPVVTLEQSEITVKAHESTEVRFTATDPNREQLTLSCTPGSQAVTFLPSELKLRIDGWKDKPGTYEATVTATDPGGLSHSATLTYTLLPNHAPQVLAPQEDKLLGLTKGLTLDSRTLFTDEDGETLTLDVHSDNPNVAEAGLSKNTIYVTPRAYGSATITLTASDWLGAEATLSFRVAVVDPDKPVAVQQTVVSSDATITVNTEKTVTVKVSLYASTGALVYQYETPASAFDPLHIDMSPLAPGRYTAVLEYDGKVQKVRVIKY